MKVVSAALARTAAASVAMLLMAGTVASAQEFAIRGAGAPARSDGGSVYSAAVQTRYGSAYPALDAYADAYAYAGYGYAYAGRGHLENEYACQLSPASLEHVPCDK